MSEALETFTGAWSDSRRDSCRGHCRRRPDTAENQRAASRVLGPKVEGTLVLDSLIKDEPLDFFVLCSSINVLWGVPGAVDYTSANAFLDAFAASRYRGRAPVTPSTGMRGKRSAWPSRSSPIYSLSEVNARGRHQAGRGSAGFRRALASKTAPSGGDHKGVAPDVGHSGSDRVRSFGGSRNLRFRPTRAGLRKGILGPILPATIPRRKPKRSGESWKSGRISSASPKSESTTISSIWAATRCSQQRVLARIGQTFGLTVPLRVIFEAPTVRALSEQSITCCGPLCEPRGGI